MLAAVIALAPSSTSANAATARTSGTVRVNVRTPTGVPATVTVRGNATRAVAKAPSGRTAVAKLTMARGRVRVTAARVKFNGKAYGATVSRSVFTLRPRRTVHVRVVYSELRIARRLRVASLGPRQV